MYTALILAVVLTLTVGSVVLRAGKAAMSALRGDKKESEGRQEEGKRGKAEVRSPDKDRRKEQSASRNQEHDEQTVNRFAAALHEGIGETIWDGDTEFVIDGRAFEERCVAESQLSFLEVSGRNLAGREFRGFNIHVEDGESMTLTYGGAAVAKLSRMERPARAIINGQTVEGTEAVYRTNTFPLSLAPGTTIAELERINAVNAEIKACGGDPERVSATMRRSFTEKENITLLREDIVPKIQERESLRAGRSNERSPDTGKGVSKGLSV